MTTKTPPKRNKLFLIVGAVLIIAVLYSIYNANKNLTSSRNQLAGSSGNSQSGAGSSTPSPVALQLMETLEQEIADLKAKQQVWSSVGGQTLDIINKDLKAKQAQLNDLLTKYV